MTSAVAERIDESTIPKTYEMKDIIIAGDRDIIAELAETDEIKISRKECREFNESFYDGDILSFASALSFMCGKNVYVGENETVYFEILDMRDFLLMKYAELPENEAIKYSEELSPYLKEADKRLSVLRSRIINHSDIFNVRICSCKNVNNGPG